MGLIRLVKYHITCKISFLTVVLMKIQVVWNIIPCQPVSGYIFLRIKVQPYSMSCSPRSHGLLHTEGDSTGFFHNFDICKSMHHHTIQIIQPTRCNIFTSLLLDVYVWLNMFRASPAHRREHTTALGASGFTVGEKRLEHCWSWSGRSARPRPTTL
jgi:hypothetical protein